MDSSKGAYVAILFTLYICTVNGYNSKNNGLGYFPNVLSSHLTKQQTFKSYVYPNQVPVPSYIKSVQQPMIHAAMPAPSYVVPTPKMLYPAMLPAGVSRFVHAGHAAYKPFYNHQDVVTKSVIYSVLLSEILRRI